VFFESEAAQMELSTSVGDAMQRTLYLRLRAGALTIVVAALCMGCKPAGKAGGVANADSAASSSPPAASQ
jgi:hypothetical protein